VSTLHMAVQANDDTKFGQFYVDKIGSEQL
jgi:hypothetical protein